MCGKRFALPVAESLSERFIEASLEETEKESGRKGRAFPHIERQSHAKERPSNKCNWE